MRYHRRRQIIKGNGVKVHAELPIPILRFNAVSEGAGWQQSDKEGSVNVSFAGSTEALSTHRDFEGAKSTLEQQRAGRELAGAEARIETSGTPGQKPGDTSAGVGSELDSETRNIAKPKTVIELHMSPYECYIIEDGRKYALGEVFYISSFNLKGKECVARIKDNGQYVLTYNGIEIPAIYSVGDKYVYIFAPSA